jgi:hypothetical protein
LELTLELRGGYAVVLLSQVDFDRGEGVLFRLRLPGGWLERHSRTLAHADGEPPSVGSEREQQLASGDSIVVVDRADPELPGRRACQCDTVPLRMLTV